MKLSSRRIIALSTLLPICVFASPGQVQKNDHKDPRPPYTLPAKKIASVYHGAAHKLYVYDRAALLKGIEARKFLVKWDGRAAYASVRYAVNGGLRTDEKVQVLLGGKPGEYTGDLGQAGIKESVTRMVFNARIEDYTPFLSSPHPILTSIGEGFPSARSYRNAWVHYHCLRGDGNESGQESYVLWQRNYVYSRPDGTGFLGHKDAGSGWVLYTGEWPNP